MKIGELARRLGVTTRTLRFYEERGLLAPARSDKGTRRYDENDVKRLEAILRLARLGVPLEELAALARTPTESATGDEASHRVAARLGRLGEQLQAQMRELLAVQADLARAVALVQECFGCPRPPTQVGCGGCPVAERLGKAQVMHLIREPDHER